MVFNLRTTFVSVANISPFLFLPPFFFQRGRQRKPFPYIFLLSLFYFLILRERRERERYILFLNSFLKEKIRRKGERRNFELFGFSEQFFFYCFYSLFLSNERPGTRIHQRFLIFKNMALFRIQFLSEAFFEAVRRISDLMICLQIIRHSRHL